jgi:hypothetical protein
LEVKPHFRFGGGIIYPTLRRAALLLAVVGTKVSSSPSTNSATAAALDVAQNFFGMEAINR